jgi:hypothetical protein
VNRSRGTISVDRVIGVVAAIIGGLGIVLYSRYRHDIWIDEFLHFAIGSMSTTAEAWSVIVQSIGTFNFNQTGIYMLVDFWLLKLFGASALALRLPSLLSAAWLLICASVFCRVRGLGNLWQVVLITALLAQPWVMNFAAEARPYMPLAAAAVGTLTFYVTPIERRRGWPWLVGIVSVALGALMHPYFPGYWAAMICLGFLLALVEGQVRIAAHDILRFCDARLVVLGLAVYCMVGTLTWMRGATALDLDPFQWIHRDQLVAAAIDWTHLAFIYDFGTSRHHATNPRLITLFLMIASVLAYPLLPQRLRASVLALLPPVVLAVGALVISAVLSWMSYRQHYWILGRQWIASVALMPFAVIWYVAEVGRQFDQWRRWSSTALALGCLIVLACSLANIVPQKVVELRHDIQNSSTPQAMTGDQQPPKPLNNDQWVALANTNIADGGPVWSVFRQYYGR